MQESYLFYYPIIIATSAFRFRGFAATFLRDKQNQYIKLVFKILELMNIHYEHFFSYQNSSIFTIAAGFANTEALRKGRGTFQQNLKYL